MKIINNFREKLVSIITVIIILLGNIMLIEPYGFEKISGINANLHSFSILSLIMLSITWYVLMMYSAFIEAPVWMEEHLKS